MYVENVFCSFWKLVIVKKVFCGSDGLVRVVEIKINFGVINCLIYFLYFLEVILMDFKEYFIGIEL